jgi:hypothetical protein
MAREKSTAKRFRPEAQGCFNPGKGLVDLYREAVASSHPRTIRRVLKRRNPVRGLEFVFAVNPGLKQPWASGRNRFAVNLQHHQNLQFIR